MQAKRLLAIVDRMPTHVKQISLSYKGFTWRNGTHYKITRNDGPTIDVYKPLFRPTSWRYDGTTFVLKCGSNSSSTLYRADRTKIGAIEESSRSWDIAFDGQQFTLHMLKRGFVLKSKHGYLATLKLDAIGRITCKSNEKRASMALLIYVVVYLRMSLGG